MDGKNCSGVYLSISLGGSWIICSLVLFAVFGKLYKLYVFGFNCQRLGLAVFIYFLGPFLILFCFWYI